MNSRSEYEANTLIAATAQSSAAAAGVNWTTPAPVRVRKSFFRRLFGL